MLGGCSWPGVFYTTARWARLQVARESARAEDQQQLGCLGPTVALPAPLGYCPFPNPSPLCHVSTWTPDSVLAPLRSLHLQIEPPTVHQNAQRAGAFTLQPLAGAGEPGAGSPAPVRAPSVAPISQGTTSLASGQPAQVVQYSTVLLLVALLVLYSAQHRQRRPIHLPIWAWRHLLASSDQAQRAQ